MADQAEQANKPKARRAATDPDRRGNINQRLNYLVEQVHPAGAPPHSAAFVANWVVEHGGKLTAVYVQKLRNGHASNPSFYIIEQLSRFYCVPITFWTDEDPPPVDGPALDKERRLLGQPDLTKSVLDRFPQLTERSQRAVSDLIDSLLAAEGQGVKSTDSAGE